MTGRLLYGDTKGVVLWRRSRTGVVSRRQDPTSDKDFGDDAGACGGWHRWSVVLPLPRPNKDRSIVVEVTFQVSHTRVPDSSVNVPPDPSFRTKGWFQVLRFVPLGVFLPVSRWTLLFVHLSPERDQPNETSIYVPNGNRVTLLHTNLSRSPSVGGRPDTPPLKEYTGYLKYLISVLKWSLTTCIQV